MTCELLTKVLDARAGLANCDNASLSQPRGCPWQAVLDSARLARSRAPLTVSMDAHREHFTMAPFPGAISVQCSTSTLSGWPSAPKRGGSSSSATIHDQALHRSTCRPPDPIQIAHFGSAANRTYITQPYSLTYPGIGIHEIEPWQEADQTWRRLAVHFPPGNANHNPDQIFNN